MTSDRADPGIEASDCRSSAIYTQLRGWNSSQNLTQFSQAEFAGMFGTHIDGSRRPALQAATSTVNWTTHLVCRLDQCDGRSRRCHSVHQRQQQSPDDVDVET